jgi:hypothetical protein
MRWAGFDACLGATRNVYEVLIGIVYGEEKKHFAN